MDKFKTLLENYPDEVNEIINKLYYNKFPNKRDKKTIFKFKAMGKNYDSDIFTKNYIEFIKDISNIHPYEMFNNSVVKCYISKTYEGMKQSHKIKDGFYITGYSSTNRKINHIKKLCGLLEINLKEI
jgi:hypothetical protein